MTDPIERLKIRKKLRFLLSKLEYRFSMSLIRSCHQTLEIQSDSKSSREALILLKNNIMGFQKLLIKILLLDYRNSKILRVREKLQYGG